MAINSFNDLKDKICVVTGASGVFGRVFAKALLDAGAKVAIVDYKRERCAQTAAALEKETGGHVLGTVANVLDKESLVQAKIIINKELGKINVLVNTAGGNSPSATAANEFIDENNISDLSKSFFGLSLDGFKSVFDLNFTGTLLPIMIFSEDMLKRNGSVINISSMNSFRPLTKIPAYSAAKAAVNNFTQWLAVHFAKADVRVNAIAPGFFLTNQNRFLLTDEKTGELTARGKKIISNTPMGRFGEPEELIGTLLYLASDASKFVTGIVVPVDGGFGAYSGV
ncbi:MAG: SDR family oxidoreductase [Bacteroidetes bacterium]|nr:SDR family oxidoreductase [Bacteroidota bacterium]MCL6100437.1 SDR family oxidoreductase [Bacteroidota bacterium]